MGHANQSLVTEFVFRPFSSVPMAQQLLFGLFLLLYLTIISSNASILGVVCTDRSLHSPMYFFLGSLSGLEVCYTTVVVPQMLASVWDAHTAIPVASCWAQMFFFVALGSADCFLLAVMAYDRYVAIRHPLRYALIMTRRLCRRLVAASLFLGGLLSLELTALVFALPFCSRQINHFLCDVPPVLRLACGSTRLHQTVLFSVGVAVLAVPFLLICLSYALIAAAVLRIRSAEGRRRAFHTCSSHLTVVLLQYGCCGLVYLRPRAGTAEDEDRQIALIYTFVTPEQSRAAGAGIPASVRGTIHPYHLLPWGDRAMPASLISASHPCPSPPPWGDPASTLWPGHATQQEPLVSMPRVGCRDALEDLGVERMGSDRQP